MAIKYLKSATVNRRLAVKAALLRAIERDKEKGGDGTRDTREVADYCGFSLSATRRHLHALWKAKEIEAFDGEGNGMGKAILWRVAALSQQTTDE